MHQSLKSQHTSCGLCRGDLTTFFLPLLFGSDRGFVQGFEVPGQTSSEKSGPWVPGPPVGPNGRPLAAAAFRPLRSKHGDAYLRHSRGAAPTATAGTSLRRPWPPCHLTQPGLLQAPGVGPCERCELNHCAVNVDFHCLSTFNSKAV